jgi:hypothetical protein
LSDILTKLDPLVYQLEVTGEQVCIRWLGECPPRQAIVFPLFAKAQRRQADILTAFTSPVVTANGEDASVRTRERWSNNARVDRCGSPTVDHRCGTPYGRAAGDQALAGAAATAFHACAPASGRHRAADRLRRVGPPAEVVHRPCASADCNGPNHPRRVGAEADGCRFIEVAWVAPSRLSSCGLVNSVQFLWRDEAGWPAKNAGANDASRHGTSACAPPSSHEALSADRQRTDARSATGARANGHRERGPETMAGMAQRRAARGSPGHRVFRRRRWGASTNHGRCLAER